MDSLCKTWMSYRAVWLGWMGLAVSAPLFAASNGKVEPNAVSAKDAAEPFFCSAVQSSHSELPLLEASCPIGQGLWNQQQPKTSHSRFWIQCGMVSQPVSLAAAAPLYQHISADVWNRPEGKQFRCLIGPYDYFAVATRELSAIKQLTNYREAFLREVPPSSQTASAQTTPAHLLKPSTSSKPVAPLAAAAPSEKVPQSAQAAAAGAKGAGTPNVSQSTATPKPTIGIRLQTDVAGVSYRVPYLVASDEMFYMEHGLPWNRLSYERAQQVCQQLDMTLPTTAQWAQLLRAQQVDPQQWPLQIPYWGEGRKGLFADGKVTQLDGSSRLNVVCAAPTRP